MIYEHELDKLSNYLAAQINADYLPNRGYYYDYYNKFSNIMIAARWRKRRGRPPCGKLGERICYYQDSQGELINILENKTHKRYCNRC